MDIGLARVSSIDQDPQLQINALERAGAWPIYVEHISGVSTRRPVRDEVLRTAKAGDTITVWKLDRIGRSMTEVVGTIEDLTRRGIRFRCLTQNIDTADTSATGKMQLQLLAMFAEFERTLLLERTAAGRQRRLDEGKHPGGVALYGFAADHETVIEAEAEPVREAARRILDGEPMNRIIKDWNKRGLRTRSGSQWTVKTLRRVLANERVIPILGRETYDKLARLFGQPDRQRLGRPAERLLSGILSCSRCGQPLYATHVQQRNGSHRLVYACKKGTSSGGRFTGCGSMVISLARADAWAEEMFVAAVVSDDFAQALDRRQAELLAEEVTAQELDEWRQEMAELEQAMPTRYAPPNARERHAELRRMVDQATTRLLAAPDLRAMADLPRSEDQLRDRWAAWSTAERRTWLRRLVETIVVHPATTRSKASDVESRMDPRWRI